LAADLHSLALLYEAQGKLAEAEPLFQKAIRARGPELLATRERTTNQELRTKN
jgi:hypothetical protein